MKISVVTTLYKSEAFIEEFYRRTREALAELGADYEIVFVNDGSPDTSLARVLEVCRSDPGVKVIDRSRVMATPRDAQFHETATEVKSANGAATATLKNLAKNLVTRNAQVTRSNRALDGLLVDP